MDDVEDDTGAEFNGSEIRVKGSRLTLDDSLTDCGRCMLRTANPDGALFTATPSVT